MATESPRDEAHDHAGSRARLVDGALLLALLTVALLVTRLYVSRERHFYYWDQAVFQDLAWNTAAAFHESWAAGWDAVGRSLHEDYNALFALPFAPLLRRLGDTRLAYEYCLVCFTFVPFVLSIGVLATRLTPVRQRAAFWSASALALTLPVAWVPMFRGYPDAAGALLVVLATAVFLRDERLERTRDALLAGVLLALAVLVRRHFVYAVTAFALAAVLHGALWVTAEGPRGRDRLGAWARQLLGLAAGGALVFVAIGRPFLNRLATHDLLALYESYEVPATTVGRFFVAPYGWLAIAGAFLGLLLAWRSGDLRRMQLGFIVLLGAVTAAQWTLYVRQVGEQYTLHFTPFVALGLWAMAWTLWPSQPGRGRAVAFAGLSGVLALNLSFGLGGSVLGKQAPWRPLFAGGWPPLFRWDYEAIGGLVAGLRKSTLPEEGLFVAASSHTFNPDLLRHAEWAQYGRENARLRILRVPAVDSRDYYPLTALLDAQCVIVADPLQLHLRPEEQRVVTIVHDLFATHAGLARDFVRDPGTIALNGGAGLGVFRRARPTDLTTALETLSLVRRAVPERPGMQPDWEVVNRRFTSWLTRNPDGSTRWAAHPAPRNATPATMLAYLGDAPASTEATGTVRFVDARCQGATLAFSTVDASGRATPLGEVRRRPGEDGAFGASLGRAGHETVLLSLFEYAPGVSIDYCLLVIDPLILRPATDAAPEGAR